MVLLVKIMVAMSMYGAGCAFGVSPFGKGKLEIMETFRYLDFKFAVMAWSILNGIRASV